MYHSELYGDGGDLQGDELQGVQMLRDLVFTKFSMRRGAAPARAGRAPLDRRNAWGGALRTTTESDTYATREDDMRGRAVPVGFARYTSPVIDLDDYKFSQLAAWRVAIPRALTNVAANDLLYRIWRTGPASAGYVRIGDMLVPAGLDPGSRSALSYMPDLSYVTD
jgi:hypothetical protein